MSTGSVSAYPVINPTHIIHVYFDIPNALSAAKLGTSNRSAKLLSILPRVMMNHSVLVLFGWLFLMIIYLCPRFCKVISVTGKLKTLGGLKYLYCISIIYCVFECIYLT